MVLEVCDKVVVELFAEKMRATTIVILKSTSTHSLLSCTEVVDCCIKTHVGLHIHTLLKFQHDLVHTDLEVVPTVTR